MAKTPITITNFLVPASTEVSHFLASDNQLVIADGVNYSFKQGEIRKDLGYAALSTAIHAKPINSLFDFRQSAVTQKILATIDDATSANTELWYWNGTAWVQITTTVWNTYHSQRVSMESFIGYCFFAGTDASNNFLPVASLTDTTFSTSTNVTTMPQAMQLIKYRDRLYAVNCHYSGTDYPFRIFFSSTPSAGSITWTPATDFLDVDYSEALTGAGVIADRLVAFTAFTAYLYDESTWQDQCWPGCSNWRTIQSSQTYLVYASDDNVWCSPAGGRPQAVGNDIRELLRNSTTSARDSAISQSEYNLYLGATSANGISYSNCLATLDLNMSCWRWRELNDTMTAVANVRRSNEDYFCLGGSTGKIYLKSRYNDTFPVYADDGVAIMGWFRTRMFDLGDPTVKKLISSLIFYSERAGGLKMYFRTMDSNQKELTPWKEIGCLDQVVKRFEKSIEGFFIQFEGKEYSKNPYFKFNGLSILEAPSSKHD